MKEFLKQMITAHTGISSKRVCGVIGFIVVVIVLLYCTLMCVLAPVMIDTFMYIIALLLGIDSVTGIWLNKPNNLKDLLLNKEVNA